VGSTQLWPELTSVRALQNGALAVPSQSCPDACLSSPPHAYYRTPDAFATSTGLPLTPLAAGADWGIAAVVRACQAAFRRMGGRVVYGTGLENRRGFTLTGGSNPSPSASHILTTPHGTAETSTSVCHAGAFSHHCVPETISFQCATHCPRSPKRPERRTSRTVRRDCGHQTGPVTVWGPLILTGTARCRAERRQGRCNTLDVLRHGLRRRSRA
jgi:hypothetical protein